MNSQTNVKRSKNYNKFGKKCMKLEPDDRLTNKLAYIVKLYTHLQTLKQLENYRESGRKCMKLELIDRLTSIHKLYTH